MCVISQLTSSKQSCGLKWQQFTIVDKCISCFLKYPLTNCVGLICEANVTMLYYLFVKILHLLARFIDIIIIKELNWMLKCCFLIYSNILLIEIVQPYCHCTSFI